MKILFFFTTHPRLEMITKIQADILVSHISKGDQIYIIKDFRNNISKSQINYNSTKSNLFYYKCVFNNLLSNLNKKGGEVIILDYKEFEEFIPQKFESVRELKKFKYKNYELGMYAASSLISLIRDHEFDTLKYNKEINRELKNTFDVLSTISFYHKTIQPELVYLFNGRMSVYAPIVYYSKENNLDFKVFEFSLVYDKYDLINNNIPHNIGYRRQEMLDLWEDNNIPIKDKERIAIDFFERQRKGISSVERSYVGLQSQDIDESVIKGKEVISFFNSSIDEYAAVPGWENYVYLYDSEVDAIMDICNHYLKDKNKVFILRIHPNLKFLDNTQNRNLQKLKSITNLIVINPQSTIRSYSILERSDKVITFGSTIGVEACYFQKPVLCLGLSFYEHLDVAYVPDSKEQLFEYLDDISLSPKIRENALIYGYWRNSFGVSYNSFISGKIKEKDYKLTDKQRRRGILMKITDSQNYRRLLKVINPKNHIFSKLRDSSYRKSILREIMPWKVK